MNNKYSAITGMKDILPAEVGQWQFVENTARDHFCAYNYQEIRTPLLEETDLFERGIGKETGVVKKEMYTFLDKSGDSITLRPEGTASVVRAYIEHHLDQQDPVTKLYYLGPMFRYERPQKGRFRQFHQIGCELIGPKSFAADVEVIAMLDHFVRMLGITAFRLEINSLGCLEATECRPTFLKKIRAYFETQATLCSECQKKREQNPLRILDCKNETCRAIAKTAPVILESLCSNCSTHFNGVKMGLESLKVPYTLNARIVRGLDYYDKTAFELISDDLGAQNAFAGGGRYSSLIPSMGGPMVPGIGFAIGMERLLLLLPKRPSVTSKKIYFAVMGETAQGMALELTTKLRAKGLLCDMDFDLKSLKSQMRRADKNGFTHVVILGDQEIANQKAPIKDLKKSTQEEVALDQLTDYFVSLRLAGEVS